MLQRGHINARCQAWSGTAFMYWVDGKHAELSDTPRLLLPDPGHWESGRVIETWSYRWAASQSGRLRAEATPQRALQRGMAVAA